MILYLLLCIYNWILRAALQVSVSHSNRLPRFNRPLKAMFKSTAGDDVVFVERTAGCAVWLMLYFPQILYSTKSTKSERPAFAGRPQWLMCQMCYRLWGSSSSHCWQVFSHTGFEMCGLDGAWTLIKPQCVINQQTSVFTLKCTAICQTVKL